MSTWLGSRQHSSKRTSSGSFGFNASLVSSRNNVANMSRFSADRANTGRHCGFNKPQILIITSSSRMLLMATMSLLMSYCKWKGIGNLAVSSTIQASYFEDNNWKWNLTPVFLVMEAIDLLSGSFANIFNAKSATHWISCCKLCNVDGSTVKSFGSRPMRTLSISAGTDSDKTIARFSAGPLSWLVRSDGLNRLLNAINMEWSISKLVRSCAFDWPDTDNRYKFVLSARKLT